MPLTVRAASAYAAVILGLLAVSVASAAADTVEVFPEFEARAEGFLGRTFLRGVGPGPTPTQSAHDVITHGSDPVYDGSPPYRSPTQADPATYEVSYFWSCIDEGSYVYSLTFPDGMTLAAPFSIPATPCHGRWTMQARHTQFGYSPEVVIKDTWSLERPYRDIGEHDRVCVQTGRMRHCMTYRGSPRHIAHLPTAGRRGQRYTVTLGEAGDTRDAERLQLSAVPRFAQRPPNHAPAPHPSGPKPSSPISACIPGDGFRIRELAVANCKEAGEVLDDWLNEGAVNGQAVREAPKPRYHYYLDWFCEANAVSRRGECHTVGGIAPPARFVFAPAE